MKNNFMETQRVMTNGPNMIESDDVPLRSKRQTVLSSPTN